MTEHLHPENLPEPAFTAERTNIADRLKVGAAAVAFAFQQSPANEAIRAYAGVNVYDATHNPLIVGAAVGAITFAIEGLSSYSISQALNSNATSVERLKNRFQKGDIDEQQVRSNKVSDMAVAMGIGAGAVVVKRHIQEVDRTLEKDVRTSLKTSGAIAGASAVIAGLAGGGIEYASRVGLERPAEVAVEVLSDWRTYVGALVIAQAYSFTKKRVQSYRQRRSNNV